MRCVTIIFEGHYMAEFNTDNKGILDVLEHLDQKDWMEHMHVEIEPFRSDADTYTGDEVKKVLEANI